MARGIEMGKMGWAIMSIIIIELALYLLGGLSTANGTFLFNFLSNPSTKSVLYVAVVALLTAFSVAVFVSSFIQLNTPAVYAIFSLGLLGLAGVIIQLMSFIAGQVNGLNPVVAWIINGLFVFPLAIYYFTTLMEWVREK